MTTEGMILAKMTQVATLVADLEPELAVPEDAAVLNLAGGRQAHSFDERQPGWMKVELEPSA